MPRSPVTSIAQLPRAAGVMTRHAVARTRAAGIDPDPLLRAAGLTPEEVDDRQARLGVRQQVELLVLAAEALGDDLLGCHLAEDCDLREMGLLHFVMASSATLGEALERAERYSTIINEGICLRCVRGSDLAVRFTYVGVPRHLDRHQMEAVATLLVRIARQLTTVALRPVRMSLAHPRCGVSGTLEALLGCVIAFGAEQDEIAFSRNAGAVPLAGADPYLNELLVGYCEEALSHRARPVAALRTRVENAITPLLPHGRARVGDIAAELGIGPRTLSRRLAAEGLTFARVLDDLRSDLARQYLKDQTLSISQIAWLLGFQEVSAFTHAFKRWTGQTPTQERSSRHTSVE